MGIFIELEFKPLKIHTMGLFSKKPKKDAVRDMMNEMETKTNQKPEEMQQNKFSDARRNRIKHGHPVEILEKLINLHSLLTNNRNEYTPTTVEVIRDLTGMNTNYIASCVREKIILKIAHPGGNPRYQYKWNTIKPTKEMAVNLIKVAYNTKNKQHDERIAAMQDISKHEDDGNPFGFRGDHKYSIKDKSPEVKPDKESGIRREEDDKLSLIAGSEQVTYISSSVKDGILTVHVNIDTFNVSKETIINAVMRAALTTEL